MENMTMIQKTQKNKEFNSFNVEDFWDLSSLSKEQIQHLNTDFSLFIYGNNFGENTQYINNKLIIYEPIKIQNTTFEEVKKQLKEKFYFQDWQIKENNDSIILLLSTTNQNTQIVVAEMKSLGLNKSYITQQVNTDGLPIVAICFKPRFMQDNIINKTLCYYTEVSGTIEHFFKKYNAYPIPNIIASDILGISDSLIKKSSNDMIHYSRPIGSNNEMFEKMIYGFKSKEDFDNVLKSIDKYEPFMEKLNKFTEIDKHSKYSLKQCYYIIDNIYRLHEEDEFQELLPTWYQALLDTLYILRNCNTQTQTICNYIEYAIYLLENMTVLTLSKF